MTDTPYQFVVFSDDWGRHPSSPQHLFRRLMVRHPVLWVNTIGLRAPGANKFTLFRGLEKLRQWLRPLVHAHDNLWVLSPIMLPVSGEGLLGRMNRSFAAAQIRWAMRWIGLRRPVFWATVPTALDYVGRVGESAVVYYVTDDYSRWPGANAEAVGRADRELTAQSDLIFTCTEDLAASHRNDKAQTVLLPHAVDFMHFAAPSKEEPREIAGIPRPRACFFGLIYEKIDLELLRTLAHEIPDLQIVMIGPIQTNVQRLAAMPNVHFLGPRPYEALPQYLQATDLILVPYVEDEETLAKGPLKIRECLAAGKPVIAKSIPSLREFADVISLYDEASGFVAAVQGVLSGLASASPEVMRQRVQGQTWEARARTVLESMEKMTSRQSAVADAAGPAMAQEAKAACMVTVSDDTSAWPQFLAGHPQATIFHDPRWGQAMHEAYGSGPHYLSAWRDGRVVGLLQLIRQKSLLFGSHLCSLPYFDAAGILAEDEDAANALRARAEGLMMELGAQWVELRQLSPAGEAPSRTDKVTLRLPLSRTSADLWEQLKAKVRNQIRKAQREELATASGGEELLDEFYAVYTRNMRDLGSPPHSAKFFRSIASRFPESVRLFVVRAGSGPVAASLTLTDRHAVRVPWAGSDWRASHTCANMLLYWTMLADACDRGAACFDFGRSTRDSGTYRFKTQWEAQEVPLYWQYLMPPGRTMPELRPDSPKYRLMVACWKKLPLGMAQRLGPWVISRLS